jgi:hypothetical protein
MELVPVFDVEEATLKKENVICVAAKNIQYIIILKYPGPKLKDKIYVKN